MFSIELYVSRGINVKYISQRKITCGSVKKAVLLQDMVQSKNYLEGITTDLGEYLRVTFRNY